MVDLRTAGVDAAQFDAGRQLEAQQVKRPAPLWLKSGFWVCIVIAVAVALRRFLALVHPAQSGPTAMAGLDKTFASHAALTFAHIISATAFVLVAPLVIFRAPKSGL